MLDYFDRRWAIETTYEGARAHLGVETQRHREAIRPEGRKRGGACEGSDPAIFRTTPSLLGLYTPVTPYVHQNAERLALSPRRAAWHPKPAPTFSDAFARVRQHLWFERLVTSPASADMTEPLPPAVRGIPEAACHAP